MKTAIVTLITFQLEAEFFIVIMADDSMNDVHTKFNFSLLCFRNPMV